MRRFVHLLLCVVFPLFTIAQIVENPVFDRTDTPTFHLDKIRIDRDTSYLYFTYFAEDSSWVAISKDTYIEDTKGTKYPMLKAEGVPYSPQKLTIYRSTPIPVTLCFPRIDSDKFNLIESENESAFNIFGVNLKERYDSVYTWDQYSSFYNQALQMDSLGNLSMAIEYKKKQLETADYLFGKRSIYSGSIMYDLTLLYMNLQNENAQTVLQGMNKINNNQELDRSSSINEAISWGNKALEILNELPQDNDMREGIARIYFTVGTCYFLIHQTDKFVSYTSTSLKIRKELWGICPKYCYYLDNFVSHLIGERELDSAIHYSSEYLETVRSCYGETSHEYLGALQYSSVSFGLSLNYEKAKKYAEAAYNLSIEIDGNNSESETTINCVINLMRIYNYCKQYSNTINLGQKHITLAEHEFDIASTLSEAYENNNDVEHAIYFCEKALSLCDNNTDQYIRCMDRLGILNLHSGKYLKAKDVYQDLLCMYDSIVIQDSTFYANVLSHIGVIYSYLGNNEESLKYFHKSKQIRFELLNSNADDKNALFGNYLLSIENESGGMLNKGDDDEALAILDDGICFYKENEKWINDKNLYPRLVCLRGIYYRHKGLFSEAINCFNQALDLDLGIDSLEYASTLGHISNTYKDMGDYESALEFAKKERIIIENNVGNNHPRYVDSQFEIATLNYLSGHLPQALACAQEVLDISRKTFGYYSLKYAVRLNNIASIYDGIGDRKKSIDYKMEAFHILNHLRINYGDLYSALSIDLSHYYYPDSTSIYLERAKRGLVLSGNTEGDMMVRVLKNEALYHLSQNDTTKAIHVYNDVINMINRDRREGIEDYAELIDNLSDIYERTDTHLFLEYNDSAFHIYKKLYDKQSYNYATSLFNYGRRLYVAGNRNDSIINFMKMALNVMYSHFIDATFTMPYKETNKYWNNKIGFLFNEWVPTICNDYNTSESNKLLYNNLLFTKGVMLTADVNTRNRVLNSKNDLLISLYKQYEDLSSSLNILYSLPPEKRLVSVDSLRMMKDKIGWSLSGALGNSDNKLFNKVTWEDIRNHLEENDVAVEFGNYYDMKDKTYQKKYYYAMVINKESKYPKLFRLFEKAEIDSILQKEHIDSLKLSNLIWKPILDELPETKNIYFSPSGGLNFTGIEYLPSVNNIISFYRLSSTRELCYRTASGVIQNAVLYGGIDYNTKDNYTSENLGESIVDEELNRSISSRGSFEPLINSEEEIKQISNILKAKGVNCLLYEANHGTEESLRLLSDKNTNVLHLATHGMYIDFEEAGDAKTKYNLQFIIMDEDAEAEDKSLSRSFLVMSGGNMLMHRDSISLAGDDGILTANEISQIDLHNVDLVVLSACESALGDISSEGVFGLQRGFKKTGAKTILMSLDKVDDEATRILMVEFYRNLMSGKTKHQSLKDAQKYLRQVENGKYDKPEYWASFIMLDGLN